MLIFYEKISSKIYLENKIINFLHHIKVNLRKTNHNINSASNKSLM